MKSSKLIKRSKRCCNSPQAQNAQKCQDMCGPYMLLNGARSAPEAKFLPISSKSSKVPKLMQLRRILKIFKSLGLPAFKPSKHILKFENPPKPQKFSNLRIVLNPRGRPILGRIENAPRCLAASFSIFVLENAGGSSLVFYYAH